jgi:hypothetical protein
MMMWPRAVFHFLETKIREEHAREPRRRKKASLPSAVLLGIAGARSRGTHGLRTTGTKQAKKNSLNRSLVISSSK